MQMSVRSPKLFPSAYAYAVGVVQSLEQQMLGREVFYQLLEAPSLEMATKLLQDFGFVATIRAELNELRTLHAQLLPEDTLSGMVFIFFDFTNLKYLCKAHLAEEEPQLADLLPGWNDVGELWSLVKQPQKVSEQSMLAFYSQAVVTAVDLYKRWHDPSLIDLVLDQACYQYLHGLLRFRKATFALGYLALRVDLENILTLLRIVIRRSEQNYQISDVSRELIFLAHGTLSTPRLQTYSQGDLATAVQYLEQTKYARPLGDALHSLMQTGNWLPLERAVDELLINYLKGAKGKGYGYEPVFAYFLGRENECRLVRVVLNGKAFGLQPEVVRERLWSPYV